MSDVVWDRVAVIIGKKQMASILFSLLYRASWYYQSILFTNWCTIEYHSEQCTTHTHTNSDLIKYAATPPNQQQRCILTDYFINYNFIKLK